MRERQLPSDSASPLGSRRHVIDNDAFWHIEVFNCGYLTTPRERTLCDTKWQEILRHLHKALQEIQHLMRTKVPGRIAHASRRCKEIHTRSLKLSAYGRLLILAESVEIVRLCHLKLLQPHDSGVQLLSVAWETLPTKEDRKSGKRKQRRASWYEGHYTIHE